jgi:hypothetical protein
MGCADQNVHQHQTWACQTAAEVQPSHCWLRPQSSNNKHSVSCIYMSIGHFEKAMSAWLATSVQCLTLTSSTSCDLPQQVVKPMLTLILILWSTLRLQLPMATHACTHGRTHARTHTGLAGAKKGKQSGVLWPLPSVSCLVYSDFSTYKRAAQHTFSPDRTRTLGTTTSWDSPNM